jgi:hypothetical protein
MTRRSKITSLLCLAAGLWTLAAPSNASASCVPPDPAIVWSYPAEGATDVPVDARIFLRLNTYSRPSSITVNGVVVNSAGAGATVEDMFSPGPLTPNTAYLVTTTATGPEGPVTLELRFTTGTGTAAAVETPVLSNLRLDPYEAPSVPHTCPAVLEAQDCFDTGQDVVVRADATGNPTMWVLWSYPAGDAGPVAPRLLASWPGECGAPSYVTHRDRFEMDPSCLRVTAVGANGEISQSNFLCPEELPPMMEAKGCSAGPTSRAPGVACFSAGLALAALGVRRRRRAEVGGRRHKA